MSADGPDPRAVISSRESLLLAAGICFVLMVLILPGAFLIPGRDAGVFPDPGLVILRAEIPSPDA